MRLTLTSDECPSAAGRRVGRIFAKAQAVNKAAAGTPPLHRSEILRCHPFVPNPLLLLSPVPIHKEQRQTASYQEHKQHEPRLPTSLPRLLELDVGTLCISDARDRIVIQPIDRLGLARKMRNERRLKLSNVRQRALGLQNRVERGLHRCQQVGVLRGQRLHLLRGDLARTEAVNVVVVIVVSDHGNRHLDRRHARVGAAVLADPICWSNQTA